MNSQIYCKCEHTIDLRVEIIVKDNAQLLDVLEKVNGMMGLTMQSGVKLSRLWEGIPPRLYSITLIR